MMRRAVGEDEVGGIVEVEAFRKRHHELRVADRVRAEAARAGERGNGITDFQMRDAFADRVGRRG